MTTITAHVVADSVGHLAPRLTTMLLRYPLIIHAELMTHRVFSRNAASSRAIPFKKMLQSVTDDPFVPLVWTKNEPGMQGYEELEGGKRSHAEWAWTQALNAATHWARVMVETGVHKQIVNRLLAPFAHITVLVTSTEWDNWFQLRDHEKAEPHIRILAKAMRTALDTSTPKLLMPGEWHLPYIGLEVDRSVIAPLIRKSVACCASVSYRTVDGFEMTQERADRIYRELVGSKPLHASPSEHQAQVEDDPSLGHLRGNLAQGWVQVRKLLEVGLVF